MVYQDLWALVRVGTRALPVYTGAGGRQLGGESTRFVGGIAGLIGLAQLPMPLYLSIAGGDELTTEVRVPIVALKSVGTLLGMFGFARPVLVVLRCSSWCSSRSTRVRVGSTGSRLHTQMCRCSRQSGQRWS